MILEHVLPWTLTTALVLLTGLLFRSAFRRRGRASALALAVGIGSLTLFNLLRRVNDLLAEPSRLVSDLVIVAFAVSGYALFSHRDTAFPVNRSKRVVAATVLTMSAILVLVDRIPLGSESAPAYSALPLVAAWSAFLLEPATRFWRGTRARSPVTRARLRLFAGGYTGLVLVLLAGLAGAASSSLAVRTSIHVVALVLVAAFGLAVSPPLRLREWWLRRASIRQASDLAPMGTWYWDVASDVVVWNAALHSFFGTDPSTFRASFEGFLEGVHPDDRAEVQQLISDHFETGEPFEFDHRLVTPDGEVRWLHARGHVVSDPVGGHTEAMFGTSSDVTERKCAEIEMRRSEELFRSLVESAPDASVVVGRDGCIVLVNEEATALFGYERDEMIGRSVDLLLPDDMQGAHSRHRERYADNPRRRPMATGRDLSARRKDGSHVDVDISLSPVETPDGLLVVASIRDVTERRKAERVLADALTREQEAATRLRKLDEMKNAFLEAVSHELRTPLTTVLGLGATLLRASSFQSPDMVGEFAERIVVNAERLDRLLTDLLDLDRLTRGVLEPPRRATDVAELIERVIEHIDTLGHPVDMDLEDVVAEVAPAQIERMVENLVLNAVKHTPDGTPITVRLRSDTDSVFIAVEDRGPGIPEDAQLAVFEPFNRGKGGAAQAGGTGIGLSLVAKFAELHGGRSWVEDRDGGGSSFRISLPLATPCVEITQPSDEEMRTATR